MQAFEKWLKEREAVDESFLGNLGRTAALSAALLAPGCVGSHCPQLTPAEIEAERETSPAAGDFLPGTEKTDFKKTRQDTYQKTYKRWQHLGPGVANKKAHTAAQQAVQRAKMGNLQHGHATFVQGELQ